MLYFNACPKCNTGTVQHERDPYGEYIQCVHCGFMRDIPEGMTAVSVIREARRSAEEAKAQESAA